MRRLGSRFVIAAGATLTALLAVFSPTRTVVEVVAQQFSRTTTYAGGSVGGVIQPIDIVTVMSPFLVVMGIVAAAGYAIRRRR